MCGHFEDIMRTNQRTIQHLRKLGLRCQTVEKYNMYSRRYNDLFSIIDIIMLDHSRGVVGIQACGTDFQPHIRKLTIDEVENTRAWLETPGTVLEIWGWRRLLEKKGGKRKVWKPRIQEIRLGDLKWIK